MRIRFEKRLTPSQFMQIATPIASVLLTMLISSGENPALIRLFFAAAAWSAVSNKVTIFS